jgi:hypothetical protein
LAAYTVNMPIDAGSEDDSMRVMRLVTNRHGLC